MLATEGAQNQSFVWGNELLSASEESNFHYLQDHLGSPIRLVGGENDEALAYDEFGVAVVGAGEKMHQPFGFTGYQTDNISGLYFAQARYFDPATSRFISEDYVRDGVNWYVHCYNNPLIFVDLDGLAPGDPFDSLNDAAKDFGKTTNPKSIKEDWEYGTYFYSWDEKGGTNYSYTEPHKGPVRNNVPVVDENPPIPTGTKWEGAGHTHGMWADDNRANNNFSWDDIGKAQQFNPNVPLFVVLPSGEIKIYYPPSVSPKDFETLSGTKWILPHDKNHPDLPWLHGWLFGCKNCFEYQGDC